MKIELPGITITVIKSSQETDGRVAIFSENTEAGMGPPLHKHLEQTEVFHIRKGRYQIYLEGEVLEVSEGDCAVVPPGMSHAFKNVGTEAGELVFELYPALNADIFFEKLSQLDDPKEISSLFKEYSGVLVGPSPL
jgi:quercetin dioxygenase-like cupin family protein